MQTGRYSISRDLFLLVLFFPLPPSCPSSLLLPSSFADTLKGKKGETRLKTRVPKAKTKTGFTIPGKR